MSLEGVDSESNNRILEVLSLTASQGIFNGCLLPSLYLKVTVWKGVRPRRGNQTEATARVLGGGAEDSERCLPRTIKDSGSQKNPIKEVPRLSHKPQDMPKKTIKL